MIVILKPGVSLQAMGELVKFIESQGLRVGRIVRGEQRTVIGLIGEERQVPIDRIRAFEGVEDVVPVLKPFKLVNRELQKDDTVVRGEGFRFGGGTFTVIAGPCAVESADQLSSNCLSDKAKDLASTLIEVSRSVLKRCTASI